MKAPAAARCLATRAASFSGRPFSWARTPRSSSMPVMCSGRSGPSYAAWSAVRASFSAARSRGPRCWAPTGRLPPVGLPPDGPRPPDLPRVSPDRLAPPRESLRAPPRESLCDPPRDDELPRPPPDEPPRPPPEPPRDGRCPRRSSATAALPFSTPRHPVRGPTLLIPRQKWRRGHQITGGPCQMFVRRRPTLPQPLGCSTIGAERLNFRVRYGTGCFPFRYGRRNSFNLFKPPHWCGLGLLVGNCLVDANSVCVFVGLRGSYVHVT